LAEDIASALFGVDGLRVVEAETKADGTLTLAIRARRCARLRDARGTGALYIGGDLTTIGGTSYGGSVRRVGLQHRVHKSLLGVLGVVGLSTAAIQARLRTSAQSLLTRFRQDVYTDLVAGEIAVAPDKPGAC
jgi:hypothetical protein